MAEMVETALPDSKCPVCGYHFDACTSMPDNNDPRPKPGDLSLCINCASVLYFDANMSHVVYEHPERLDRQTRAVLARGQEAIRRTQEAIRKAKAALT